jgi:hypothetical protein
VRSSRSAPKLRQKDRDARWTVKTTKADPKDGEMPMVDLAILDFGYQSHISTDHRHQLVRRWLVTDAAAYAGARLADPLDPANTASGAWTDTGYRSKKNGGLLRQRMRVRHVHREKPRGRPMPQRTARANAKKVRSPRPRRASLRRAERADGPVRPDHWPGAGDNQDRSRQPRPQHAPPDLTRSSVGARLAVPKRPRRHQPEATQPSTIRPCRSRHENLIRS